MGGRERNACIKDKEGLAFDTRLCFGYASPVDTAMVRHGLGGPNCWADSRLSFDRAAFLLAIRKGVQLLAPLSQVSIYGTDLRGIERCAGYLTAGPPTRKSCPPSWRMVCRGYNLLGDSNVNRYL